MFFDAIVLNELIPIFNYGDTFDAKLNWDKSVLGRLNDRGPVLVDIDVAYEPYWQVKTAAIAELTKLYQGERRVSQQLAESIIAEQSTAEYRWQPDIGEELRGKLAADHDRRLAQFLLGGLQFAGYAQLLGGDHVMEPKRSRLYLAVSLRQPATHELEEQLFSSVKSFASLQCEDIPWTPTFFPYLLSTANDVETLIAETLSLRESEEVADYRRWLRGVLSDWEDGRISARAERDLEEVRQSVQRRLRLTSIVPEVQVKISVARAAAPGEIDATPMVRALWGWFLSLLPGKRYRKLLSRAIAADAEYVRLDKRVLKVWSAT
jgi:hypothetical protein